MLQRRLPSSLLTTRSRPFLRARFKLRKPLASPPWFAQWSNSFPQCSFDPPWRTRQARRVRGYQGRYQVLFLHQIDNTIPFGLLFLLPISTRTADAVSGRLGVFHGVSLVGLLCFAGLYPGGCLKHSDECTLRLSERNRIFKISNLLLNQNLGLQGTFPNRLQPCSSLRCIY